MSVPSIFRYLTAKTVSVYFRLKEKSADTHIQNTAPGPPRDMATATPAIFPTPNVPARAVHKAETGEIPSRSFFEKREERAHLKHFGVNILIFMAR